MNGADSAVRFASLRFGSLRFASVCSVNGVLGLAVERKLMQCHSCDYFLFLNYFKGIAESDASVLYFNFDNEWRKAHLWVIFTK